MITIKPAPPQRVVELCTQEGVPLAMGSRACQAMDGDESLGWVLFQLEGEVCLVQAARCQPALLDGLIRSALNMADLRGLVRFDFSGRMLADWGDRLTALHYQPQGGTLAEFFSGKCPGEA